MSSDHRVDSDHSPVYIKSYTNRRGDGLSQLTTDEARAYIGEARKKIHSALDDHACGYRCEHKCSASQFFREVCGCSAGVACDGRCGMPVVQCAMSLAQSNGWHFSNLGTSALTPETPFITELAVLLVTERLVSRPSGPD